MRSIVSFVAVCASVALTACQGTIAGSDGGDAATLATREHLLRHVDGEDIVINRDWSADADAYHLAPVVDGTPSKPFVSSLRFAGARALGFTTPDESAAMHKQRIEYKLARAADADGLNFGDERWIGFAMQLDAGARPFESSVIFWQAWQGYPWGPPVMLKLVKQAAPPYTVELAIRNDATGPDSASPDRALWSGAVVCPGAWSTFLVHVKPSFAGAAEIELWIDGQLRTRWSGSIGYDPARTAGAYDGLDVKFGEYQPDPNAGHTLYFDDVRFADAAAPATLPSVVPVRCGS